jgi:hypothetical protein
MFTRLTSICLCLCALFAQKAYSNVQLFPGYYIDSNGDSVRCKIEYNDWLRNPGTIAVEVNDTRKTLGPADIKGFGITGYGDYRSATVSYHLGPVTGDLPGEYSDKTETNSCFLLVLVNGPYCLYELTLQERYYFFINEKDGPVTELVYRVRQSEMMISEDEQYKNLLADYLAREHLSANQLYSAARLTYSKNKLIAIVNRLNEAHSGVKAAPAERAKPGGHLLQLDVYAGVTRNTFPSEIATYYAMARFPSAFSPEAGIGLHIVFPGQFNAFSIGLTVGYASFKCSTSPSGSTTEYVQSSTWYDSVNYTENLTVSNTLLTTNLYFMYLVPGSGKVRYYGKLGVNTLFLLKPNGYAYSNWSGNYTAYHGSNPPYPDGGHSGTYESIAFGFNAASGEIAIGAETGRHRVEVVYCSPAELGATNQPSFQLSRLGLYYFFTVLK